MIVISYRPEDAGGYAGRLYDRLRRHFGADKVYLDTGGTPLADATAVIVVIGPRWVDDNPIGQRDIDDPHDPIRHSLMAALARPEVRVIPVLVRGGALPDDLPQSLMALTRRQPMPLSDHNFHYDVGELIAVLERTKSAPTPQPTVCREEQLHRNQTWWGRARWWLLAAAIGIVILTQMTQLEHDYLICASLWIQVLLYAALVWYRPARYATILTALVPVVVVLVLGAYGVWNPEDPDDDVGSLMIGLLLITLPFTLGPPLLLNWIRLRRYR